MFKTSAVESLYGDQTTCTLSSQLNDLLERNDNLYRYLFSFSKSQYYSTVTLRSSVAASFQ